MKNLLKRCVSALTAAVVCAGLAVPISAQAASETTGITAVAEFNNFEYKNLNKTVGDNTVANHKLNPSSVAYGGGKSSLAWTLQMNSEFQYTLDTPLTISKTDTIKIRMRSSSGTQKFNIKINTTRVSTVAEITEEWSEYSYSGVESLSSVGFQCGGWSQSAYTTGATIYIDSIWIESANAAYNKVDYPLNGADDAAAEVVSFDTATAGSVSLGTAAVKWTQEATTVNARENGNGMYRYFTVPAFLYRTTTVTKTSTIDVAAGGYKYINMWVYSPRPQNGGVSMTYNKQALSEGLTVNWSGWKLVSLPLPSNVLTANQATGVSFISGVNAADKGSSMNKIIGETYKKIDSSWGSTKFVAGTTEAACTSEIQFGIESIWLSKNQPADANKDAESIVLKSAENTGTDVVIADYSKADAVIPANAAETANSYKGGKSARSRRFGGQYIAAPSGSELNYTYKVRNQEGTSKDAEFVIFDDAANPYTGIDATDYLNFWIYNPSVKYDNAANYTEYILVIRHNAGGSFVNKTFGIASNFEGWKRFSIPMSEINSNWNEDTKIETIKITTNAWLPAANTDITKVSHTHTEEELAKGYRVASTYNAWPDVYNFFDLEKVWISKEKPAESFTSDALAIGFNQKNIEITNMDFSYGTVNDGKFIGSVLGDGILLKETDVNTFEVVNSATTIDSHNVTISAADLLDTDTSYYLLYPDIYDADGNKYAEIPAFKTTTKNLYLTPIVVDPKNSASASVIYRGDIKTLVPERAKSCLIGACFDANGTLKQAKVSRYSEDNQTMAVTLDEAQTGDTVRYFLYDGASLTPFQTQVEKVIGATE